MDEEKIDRKRKKSHKKKKHKEYQRSRESSLEDDKDRSDKSSFSSDLSPSVSLDSDEDNLKAKHHSRYKHKKHEVHRKHQDSHKHLKKVKAHKHVHKKHKLEHNQGHKYKKKHLEKKHIHKDDSESDYSSESDDHWEEPEKKRCLESLARETNSETIPSETVKEKSLLNKEIRSERHQERKKEKQGRSEKSSKSSDSSKKVENVLSLPAAPRKTELLDYNFQFSKYKHSLTKILMRDKFFSAITDRRSKEHEDFWAFVQRYCAFQQKKIQQAKDQEQKKDLSSTSTSASDYNVQYRVNTSLISKDFDTFMSKGRLVDFEVDKELTKDRLYQFRSILLHFLDFQQKQKFQKLHKIQKDQRNLPIFQYKRKILDTIKQHQVIVVAGDTGCGKSTQVPQYLLEAGYDKIACTQPRRIACISLSKRVGYETLNEYGSEIAYQVRFEKSKTAKTKMLFLTEGLLLRQMTTDPLLEMYNVIVIDEVHERHIFTDFLLGVLKCILMKRVDLKVVLMSATINIRLFSDYFNEAPVIKVPGRLYPIELEYCPIKKADNLESRRIDASPYLRIMQRIDHKYPSAERGDLLIFLSGMSEIMAVVEAAKAYAQQKKNWIVLPLHSALSVEEQDKVFDMAPDGVRKVIVSTNIAETSVTIDGVRFIIDSGKVKEMSFDPKYKMQKLQEFWISRASSEQRKGRAGRTGPGVCFRLYEESEFDAFQDYATPEMQRMPLDSLILQMISMGLPDARKFPFLEAPSMTSLENSISVLKEQGALTSTESLTPIGQMLAMLPVDVVIGKILIMGSIFNMIDPVLSITAAMSVQSPFTNRAYADPEAITARKPLESVHGDPFTLLNAFSEWIQVKSQGQSTRNWSKRRGLEEQRFYEMTKLKRQFRDLLRDHHLLDGGGERKEYQSSEQRRVQHGERKRLADLRREKMREQKKRKILSVEDDDFKISDEGEDNEMADIKDLEFRLSHDLNKLQETSRNSQNFTLRDINLMKIILCSGLYPQVAIAEESNSYKRDSEQAFHTKNKPFILVHPTSIFTAQPDLLMPKDPSGKRPAPSDLKGLMSSKHELLSYVSLLETNNKPYLVNLMRVPALQTVTLFSRSIDTNLDCTRLICDGWLEFKFQSTETAEMVLSSIMQLRSTWHSLLKLRLKDTFEGIEEDRHVSPKAVRLERLLATKLAEFLDSDIPYALRRVMPAEMQRVYIGPGQGSVESAEGSSFMKSGNGDIKEHRVKGGAQITDYLTFNCLVDEATANVWGEFTINLERHWTCPQCNQSMIVSVLERLKHEAICSLEDGQGLEKQVNVESEKDKLSSLNPLRKPYFCPECNEHLSLTTIEILKHRKTHVA